MLLLQDADSQDGRSDVRAVVQGGGQVYRQVVLRRGRRDRRVLRSSRYHAPPSNPIRRRPSPAAQAPGGLHFTR